MRVGPDTDTKVLAFRQTARQTPITFSRARNEQHLDRARPIFSTDSAEFNNYRRPIHRFDGANNVVRCAVFLAKPRKRGFT